jgi:hypothetical protein
MCRLARRASRDPGAWRPGRASPNYRVPGVGMSLTLQHLPQLHGDLLDVLGIESHETVELGTVWESRECCSVMGLSVAVEVPLAREPRPPSEDGEGDDFALGEGGWRSGASLLGGVRLAEVIHDDVEYGEEGVLRSSM